MLADLAAVIGTSSMTVSRYEREESALTADLITKFCDFYGVTADYLLGRSSSPLPAVSDPDTAILAAYHAAPAEIRAIIDTALAPYLPAAAEAESAS